MLNVLTPTAQFRSLNLQLRNHLVSDLEPLHGITNELVNNSLCRLLLVHNSSRLTHQEWAGAVHSLVIKVITHLLEVVLDGDYTLGGQVLDVLCAVHLPVVDVCVVADAHGATSEDDGADVVVETGGGDGILVSLRRTSLIGDDETRTNPDGAGTEHQRRGDALAVEDTASSDNLDGLAGHGAGLALAELDNSGDKERGWDITSVATTLTTLCADEINAKLEALLHVLGVSDHVHVQDTSGVEPVNDVLGWDTDG